LNGIGRKIILCYAKAQRLECCDDGVFRELSGAKAGKRRGRRAAAGHVSFSDVQLARTPSAKDNVRLGSSP
jgi:hypothetical protein